MQIKVTYPKNAVCVLKSDTVNGVIHLTEYEKYTVIEGKLSGLKPNKKHGFHIHEYGDLTDGCSSACAHFNPYNKKHGARNSEERHVGDLGNLEGDMFGNCQFKFTDSQVRLSGDANVIGRSMIVHEDEDDLGTGVHKDSHTTGHAGKRLVCGVIGWKKNC